MVIIIVLVAVPRFVQAGWEGLLAPTAGKRCHSPRRVTARLMQVKFSSSLQGGVGGEVCGVRNWETRVAQVPAWRVRSR